MSINKFGARRGENMLVPYFHGFYYIEEVKGSMIVESQGADVECWT